MNWEFATDRPIYAQLVEMIQKRILLGIYPLGSNMPSVRMLALEASVNPNTMQKALSELEALGLLNTQRTSGRTVTDDEGMIMQVKERIATEYIEQYFKGMQSLGIERNAAASMLVSKSQAEKFPQSPAANAVDISGAGVVATGVDCTGKMIAGAVMKDVTTATANSSGEVS